MYSLLRKILFKLDPEFAHKFALKSLQLGNHLGLQHLFKTDHAPLTLMGLNFTNPVGLAAGLDKNAEYIDALSMLGFGFIEIGTVTPKPQTGNPLPRLFRLAEQEAIINRMGFNSEGIEYVQQRLAKIKYTGILGINIGKNKETPLDQAIDDYVIGFRALGAYASYITVNISSPNTSGLRDLQQEDFLTPLLSALKYEQQKLFNQQQKYVPLVVKIAPDLSTESLQSLASIFINQKIEGIIATNTTISRPHVEQHPLSKEAGGLSGRPLRQLSTQVLKTLHELLQDKIPLIASGGIMDMTSAEEKIKAGAKLLQVYTGFIYRGPRLIRECAHLFKQINYY